MRHTVGRVEGERAGQGAGGVLALDVRIVVADLDEVIIRLVGDGVFEHIEDELFLDGLSHCVTVKRGFARRAGFIKDLLGFVFRGGGKGEVAKVGLVSEPREVRLQVYSV